MSEWQRISLAQAVQLKRGFDLPESTRTHGPYPVVGSSGISGWHNEGPIDGPGVVIGRSGASIGVASYTEGPYWPLNTTLFVENFNGNNPRFIFYLLHQMDFGAFNSGSAQPSLNRNFIANISVGLPGPAEQEAIAAVLGALDDKVAVNEQIAKNADELRALRLRQWQKSTMEAIEERALSSIGSFVNGRAYTKNATGSGRMVIRIAEINSGPRASTIYNDVEVPDVHLARPGDVLFAWSGSLTVARWYRPEAIINQHIFKVIPNAGVPTWLAYELAFSKLADFKGIAADKATTMGHIQRHHLDEPVLAPKPEYMATIDAEIGPLWDRALAAEQESLTLAELRDTLLPRLMSGEVRVRDAERIVEDAT